MTDDGIEEWTNRTEREYTSKERDLLSNDFAEPCPDCGAVVFEWWDGCRECDEPEDPDGVQTTLGGGSNA